MTSNYSVWTQKADGWHLSVGGTITAELTREGYLVTKSYTLTRAFSGAVASTDLVLTVMDYGNYVVVHFPALTPKANAGATTIAATVALPTDIRPSHAVHQLIYVTDDSAAALGCVHISTAGAVTVNVGSAGNFTASNNSGWAEGFSIAYPTAF
jgi:hypothetical protein